MSEISTISVNRLAELDGQGNVEVIDVRTPAEFREVHSVIARNVPLESLNPGRVMQERDGTASHPLYVICQSGNRSGKACQKFIDAGYTNVVNVEGGTIAWDQAGLPVVRGKKAMSLQRQVQITTGFLVLLGAVLSFWNIYFALLSGLMGAGLMFSGITDTCAMGVVLAKMPWNQVKVSDGCCSAS